VPRRGRPCRGRRGRVHPRRPRDRRRAPRGQRRQAARAGEAALGNAKGALQVYGGMGLHLGGRRPPLSQAGMGPETRSLGRRPPTPARSSRDRLGAAARGSRVASRRRPGDGRPGSARRPPRRGPPRRAGPTRRAVRRRLVRRARHPGRRGSPRRHAAPSPRRAGSRGTGSWPAGRFLAGAEDFTVNGRVHRPRHGREAAAACATWPARSGSVGPCCFEGAGGGPERVRAARPAPRTTSRPLASTQRARPDGVRRHGLPRPGMARSPRR